MKIRKVYEFDQFDENGRRELIQDVIERIRLYPEYADKLKEFNEREFPIDKIAGARGTRYERPKNIDEQ